MKAPDTERSPARHRVRAQAPVVGAVAVGGGVGAAARYAATLWWPMPGNSFPWTILWVNVLGCAVIGAFMVIAAEARTAHRLLRPFFGTGVLGGFTTFSTYAVDIRGLFEAGRHGAAFLYLAVTPAVALTAVWAATAVTRRALIRRQP
ncbi:fluoride efflux transporter CrcB [Streptomyces sp. Vc74B-19]|uniref:fluoride efflux transporter CrcB n=1 Tax=unclassified Streptomyces TaxID=2593676 RepID=UPI001BFC4B9B|nr:MULTISPECIES: fluoride efflux transporter CrcB [unclassified Streptomyces]MBT3167788.1 fluoride efflux transporter CrcB [Streptomyces sp. Vc74B-19]MCO4696085.1 fluoride efflux transporter CrcB [Streptomyces sp. RO-S4]MDU0299203.1 fluoride efflux transporter CrcB [Streptomyces sp. PAL114]